MGDAVTYRINRILAGIEDVEAMEALRLAYEAHEAARSLYLYDGMSPSDRRALAKRARDAGERFERFAQEGPGQESLL